jgi:hypothetical protein
MQASWPMIFRQAQYVDRVVVAFSHFDPERSELRELRELGGDPLPPEFQGRIFVVGHPGKNAISWEQQADVQVEIMKLLHEQREKLGHDVMREGATFFAFSQGAPASVLMLRRLQEAFKGDHPFARGVDRIRIVANAGALGGGDVGRPLFGDAQAKQAHDLLNDKQYVRSRLAAAGVDEAFLQRYVPVRLAGSTDDVVTPSDVSWRDQNDTIVLPGFGHHRMADDPDVVDIAAAKLAGVTPLPEPRHKPGKFRSKEPLDSFDFGDWGGFLGNDMRSSRPSGLPYFGSGSGFPRFP